MISGKPFFAWPAYIPVTFELAVLGGALGAVLGILALNRLPRHHHPIFASTSFERASDDRFFISIERATRASTRARRRSCCASPAPPGSSG